MSYTDLTLDDDAGLYGDSLSGDPYSPTWWLKRLCRAQKRRLPMLRMYERYYEGDHPLEFATDKFRQAFGGLFREFADNWCESVINAPGERLTVVGFRFGEQPKADEEAFRIWQANGLDLESHIAHTEAMIAALCYALIWPGDDPETPRVTIEHATQMITAPAANDRRKVAAALKWYCDDEGYEVAYLYLPDTVYRFRSSTKTKSGLRDWANTRWVPEDRDYVDDPAEQPNPLAPIVPVVPIENRPRLVKPPSSELVTVIPLQDATNKLWCDMMVSSEFAAYMQRYVLGWEPDIDPETKQPKEPPWKFQDRLWYFPGAQGDGEQPTSVGQFPPGDLSSYIRGIELAVNHIASQTRTPPHYLSPSADRLSGESIKASESGLVSKVRRMMIPFGESWEQVLRLCFKLKNDRRADFIGAETIWKDPELKSDAELADAATKRKALGMPLRPILEFLGYGPTESNRIMSEMIAESMFKPDTEPPAPVPVDVQAA